MTKRYWRCNVCNDIHYGNDGPEVCPTCFAIDAYCEIDSREAIDVQELEAGGNCMSSEDVRSAWLHFTEKADFKLNPDEEHVGHVLKGVLENDSKHGLKLCPCRLRDGSRERDLKLICPCDFKSQETWVEQGRCWCGLFIKQK